MLVYWQIVRRAPFCLIFSNFEQHNNKCRLPTGCEYLLSGSVALESKAVFWICTKKVAAAAPLRVDTTKNRLVTYIYERWVLHISYLSYIVSKNSNFPLPSTSMFVARSWVIRLQASQKKKRKKTHNSFSKAPQTLKHLCVGGDDCKGCGPEEIFFQLCVPGSLRDQLVGWTSHQNHHSPWRIIPGIVSGERITPIYKPWSSAIWKGL